MFSQIDVNEQQQFQENNFGLPDPLDFLEEDSIMHVKRRPRSSIESAQRQIEIPLCQPVYISRHLRDSGRAHDYIDSFSPQPVDRKPLKFKLGTFMDNDTFEEDVDFLFSDHDERRRSPRARMCSDTNFSSNIV